MANTTFFYRAKNNPDSITWKDIFSDFRKKHTKKDLEYAMLSGTSLLNVNEGNMLEKWQKPWIFYPLLKGGLALLALIYAVVKLSKYGIWSLNDGIVVMMIFITPIILPIILMIFFWELNIPKNISIYELLAYFLVGGLLSFAVTGTMLQLIDDGPGIFEASTAAFREEPAKLIPTLLIMLLIAKKKKIYGLTGLVIGAAVGTGFGAFESVAYALNYLLSDGIDFSIHVQNTRTLWVLASHAAYTAPYSAAFALAMRKNGGLKVRCFWDGDFLRTFLTSVVMHFWWNTQDAKGIWGDIKCVVILILLWCSLLYIIKKCLKEIVIVGKNQRPMVSFPGGADIGVTAISPTFNLRGVGGYMDGRTYPINVSEITFGRDASCGVRYPSDAPGISKVHCKLFWKNGILMLMDMNSSYGTYTTKGKIPPMVPVPIQFGEVFYIAKKENQFTIQ